MRPVIVLPGARNRHRRVIVVTVAAAGRVTLSAMLPGLANHLLTVASHRIEGEPTMLPAVAGRVSW
jgi:hypothetical protein